MRYSSRAVLVVAMVFVLGCGGDAKQSAERESSNLKPLMVLYGRYIGQHQGKPPSNEAEFKEFVKTTDTSSVPGGSKDVESFFISSRDKKPYVILYGRPNGPPGPGGQPVIAYEQEGVSGKRYVASSLGAIEEVDDARFRTLVPDAK